MVHFYFFILMLGLEQSIRNRLPLIINEQNDLKPKTIKPQESILFLMRDNWPKFKSNWYEMSLILTSQKKPQDPESDGVSCQRNPCMKCLK